MNILAFVPARGGSKGIPRKNIALLDGKPLIQYTIEAVRKSKYIPEEDIFISSDEDEIINFCQSLGLKVPYKRPASLAADESPMIDCIIDALKWNDVQYKKQYDCVLLLQPTSPLRTNGDIDGAIEMFMKSNAESLISVHRMAEHPYECLKLNDAGWEYLSKPNYQATRRQDYQEEFYFFNGAIYLAKTELILQTKTFFLEGQSALYVMMAEHGIDIDEISDLKLAEFHLHKGI
jgi:CMP-N,N'-diacetyllegionaminic acid synthase